MSPSERRPFLVLLARASSGLVSFVSAVGPVALSTALLVLRALTGRVSRPLLLFALSLLGGGWLVGALGAGLALGSLDGSAPLWVGFWGLVAAVYVLVLFALTTGVGVVLERRRDRRLLESAPGVRVRLRDVRLLRVEDVGGRVRIELSHAGVDTFVLDADARPAGAPKNGLSVPSPTSLTVVVSAGDVIDARAAAIQAAPGAVEIYGTLQVSKEGGFTLAREQVSVEFPSWRGSYAWTARPAGMPTGGTGPLRRLVSLPVRLLVRGRPPPSPERGALRALRPPRPLLPARS